MRRRTGTFGPFDLHRALVRSGLSLALALAAGLALRLAHAPLAIALLAGGDAGGLCLLFIAWSSLAFASVEQTRARAAEEDPGRTAVYGLILAASAASLLAATVLVRGARTAPAPESRALIALCLLGVALAWSLTHTAFALRYAHLYYRDDADGVGGIDFPGKRPPDYFDFAYFSFTCGMCFQVSDATVTSRIIRRAVLLQATMAFAYNTVILAFVLNLAFSLA